MPKYTIQSPDGRKITVEAGDEQTAVRGAQEWAKANPRQKKSGIVEDFLEPVRGSIENVRQKYGAYSKSGDLKQAPSLMDLAAVPLSPIAGAQHALLKPVSEVASKAAYGAGLERYDVPGTIETAQSLLGGRGFPQSRPMSQPEAAKATEQDIGNALLGAMPARGAVGLAGPVRPARTPKSVITPRKPTPGDILKSVGVQTTPMQRAGGQIKGIEDTLARFPVMQQAILGQRGRQVEQLNRGVALKALEPIGKTLPKDVRPGFDTVRHVEDELSKVYQEAASKVSRVQPDQQLVLELKDIGQRSADLTDQSAELFRRAVSNRLDRMTAGVSGAEAKKIHSELGALQAEASKRGEDTLASMFGDAKRSFLGPIERTNPEAGELIRKADRGWSIYSIMNDASRAATAREGVFLPGQLNSQVRGAADRMGSNMAGKGLGPLQDIATAASKLIPDSYGNPGTANALLAGGGAAGIGGLAITNPVAAGSVLGTVGAAATPYFLNARKIIETLPKNPSVAQVKSAQKAVAQFQRADPNVIYLQAYLSRLEREARAGSNLATQAAAQEEQGQ